MTAQQEGTLSPRTELPGGASLARVKEEQLAALLSSSILLPSLPGLILAASPGSPRKQGGEMF